MNCSTYAQLPAAAAGAARPWAAVACVAGTARWAGMHASATASRSFGSFDAAFIAMTAATKRSARHLGGRPT